MIKPVALSSISPPDQALRKATQGFEAVFLREIIGSMRKGKLAEEMFGSSATENFRELADARTAESIAKLGQFGIANMVEKQLGQAQNSAHFKTHSAIASEAKQSRVVQDHSGLLRRFTPRNDGSGAIK
jgi:peptidoglycan hydrolase FlgJ